MANYKGWYKPEEYPPGWRSESWRPKETDDEWLEKVIAATVYEQGHWLDLKAIGTEKYSRFYRKLYLVLVGDIPPKYDLDHVCRVRACHNVDHLEPVTRQENVLRGIAARKNTAPIPPIFAGLG